MGGRCGCPGRGVGLVALPLCWAPSGKAAQLWRDQAVKVLGSQLHLTFPAAHLALRGLVEVPPIAEDPRASRYPWSTPGCLPAVVRASLTSCLFARTWGPDADAVEDASEASSSRCMSPDPRCPALGSLPGAHPCSLGFVWTNLYSWDLKHTTLIETIPVLSFRCWR